MTYQIITDGAENSLIKESKGHVYFSENFEYFIREDTGHLYRAPKYRPIFPDGYRQGRWEATHRLDEHIENLKKSDPENGTEPNLKPEPKPEPDQTELWTESQLEKQDSPDDIAKCYAEYHHKIGTTDDETWDWDDPEPQTDTANTEPQTDTANTEPQTDTADTEPQTDTADTEPQTDTVDTEPQTDCPYKGFWIKQDLYTQKWHAIGANDQIVHAENTEKKLRAWLDKEHNMQEKPITYKDLEAQYTGLNKWNIMDNGYTMARATVETTRHRREDMTGQKKYRIETQNLITITFRLNPSPQYDDPTITILLRGGIKKTMRDLLRRFHNQTIYIGLSDKLRHQANQIAIPQYKILDAICPPHNDKQTKYDECRELYYTIQEHKEKHPDIEQEIAQIHLVADQIVHSTMNGWTWIRNNQDTIQEAMVTATMIGLNWPQIMETAEERIYNN